MNHPQPDRWPATCHFCGATEVLDDWGAWAPTHLTEDTLDAELVVAPVCPDCTDRHLRLCDDAHGRSFTLPDGEVVRHRHSEYVPVCPPLPGPAGPPLDEALRRIEAAIDRLAEAIRATRD